MKQKAYIKDTVCGPIVYRVIGWKEYTLMFSFAIRTDINSMVCSMEDEERDVLWSDEIFGDVPHLLRLMGIMTIALNGYIEPSLTYEGFIWVRNKAISMYNEQVEQQRAKFHRS